MERDPREPDAQQLKVLEALARGEDWRTIFMHDFVSCIVAGWVDRGRLTALGRDALEAARMRSRPPIRVKLEVRAVPDPDPEKRGGDS